MAERERERERLTGGEVPAGVGDALLGVEDREELEGVCGAGHELVERVGHRVRRNDARPRVAGDVEALDAQPEARVVALPGRLPVHVRRLAVPNGHRQVRGRVRG